MAGKQLPRPRIPSAGARESAARTRWPRALRRTPVSLWTDDVTDWAAALTYYAMLAIFPALLVTLSLVGLRDPDDVQNLIREIGALVPPDSRDIIEETLRSMARRRSAARLLLVLGTVSALWSASSYLAVFRRALYSMYRIKDQRPVWRTAPRIVATAVALLTLLAISALALTVTEGLARAAGRLAGAGDAAVAVGLAFRWPVLLLVATVLVMLLFRAGPESTRGVRRMAPGGLLAVFLWLGASVGLYLYMAQVGTYDRLYGSLAGLIVFLMWLWFSNLALLAGAQFNAELARTP
ncbi:membrane protein [Streptomyces sp. SLBN-134]|nr:membrane protein [Streptomyces sp. SLBN-134]